MRTRTARPGWRGTVEQGSGMVEPRGSSSRDLRDVIPDAGGAGRGGATSPEELIGAALTGVGITLDARLAH